MLSIRGDSRQWAQYLFYFILGDRKQITQWILEMEIDPQEVTTITSVSISYNTDTDIFD